MQQKITSASKAAAGFVEFVGKSVSPFHAVSEMMDRLGSQGYQTLKENEPWPELAPGGRFMISRNGSSLVAFAIGGKYDPAKGLKIVGAHTDSPNFAVKPNPKLRRNGFAGIGVQPYGGGLWHTWFDRDLTLAGRVVVTSDNGRLESRLLHVQRPIMRIPNLAIHLTTAKERESGFAPNKESHLVPVMAMESALNGPEEAPEGQCPVLLKLLADELKVDVAKIVDFDLSVVDTQPPAIGGLNSEFVFAPRIDNLLSCYCGLEAMFSADSTLAGDSMVRVFACFDHEEVGSSSAPGAGGSIIPDIVERLLSSCPALRPTAVANSFLLSVDGAHGLHPNYADRHESNHRPHLHQGPVIKYNANQRYATSGETAAVVVALARRADVPVQKFCVKNDSPCGSTIGPILTTLSGIRGADVGNAMLSMHSVREMCGTVDIPLLERLIAEFFTSFDEVRMD